MSPRRLTVALGLLISCCAHGAQFRILTVDETGAGFADVLVIVKSLEGKGEKFRALTDKSGAVSAYELSEGLYQIIATCPYGICQTTVREVIVANQPVDLKLSLKVLPTVGNAFTVGRIERRRVEVLDSDGRPVTSAQVLVRDAAAQHQRWYQTGVDGKVEIALPHGLETTVIAVHQGRLASRALQTDGSKLKSNLVLLRF